MFHVKHPRYLPRQKDWKITSRTASTSTLPTRKSSARRAPRSSSATSSTRQSARSSSAPAAATRSAARRDRLALTRVRCRPRRRHPRLEDAGDALQKRVDPLTGHPRDALPRHPPCAGPPWPARPGRPPRAPRRGAPRPPPRRPGTPAGPPPPPAPAPARRRGFRPGRPARRSPAMSSSVSGSPPRSIRTSRTSRVVPATSEVSAASRRASAFSSVDLPTFGRPTSATSNPSRTRSAIRPPLSSCCIAAWTSRSASGDRGEHVRRQLLVGEVDARLDEGERPHQRRFPSAPPASTPPRP